MVNPKAGACGSGDGSGVGGFRAPSDGAGGGARRRKPLLDYTTECRGFPDDRSSGTSMGEKGKAHGSEQSHPDSSRFQWKLEDCQPRDEQWLVHHAWHENCSERASHEANPCR